MVNGGPHARDVRKALHNFTSAETSGIRWYLRFRGRGENLFTTFDPHFKRSKIVDLLVKALKTKPTRLHENFLLARVDCQPSFSLGIRCHIARDVYLNNLYDRLLPICRLIKPCVNFEYFIMIIRSDVHDLDWFNLIYLLI